MLLSFTCGNYRSFKEEKSLDLTAVSSVKEFIEDNVISVDRYKLLKCSVIYGANASGKSNLVKAMSKMKWMIINSSKNLQKGELLNIDTFKLSTKMLDKPAKFEISFLIDKVKYRYGFEADNNEIVSEWLFRSQKVKEETLFIREKDEIEVFSKFKEGRGLEDRTRENALFLSVCAQFNGEVSVKVLNWFLRFNPISGNDDIIYQSFSENMFMGNNDDRNSILEFVRKADLGINDINIRRHKLTGESISPAIPEEVKKMLIDKEGSVISTLHNVYDENNNVVSNTIFDFEFHESEGSKKYFRLSGPIWDTLKKGNILIIDELDARLHPILVTEIVKLFNSKETNPLNAQLIFATHDTNLLSAKIFRRDQIWFTEKNNEEATDLYSLVEYKLPRGKVRNDASFEKDYIRGRYGAIPFVGDFKSIWSVNGKSR